jgi:uncharacterized protein (UPF0335 family)
MPATSQAQQKFMGIVHGLQKGKVKPSDVSGKAQDVAKHIAPSDATAFASTKHKGLPKKKKVKEQLMQGQLGQIYAVKKPYAGCELSSLVQPVDPLVGLGPDHEVVPDKFHGVFSDEESAQSAANELYEAHLEHENLVEDKKGKAVDGLKKAIDRLEKKRKEHVDLVKEDPKNAGQHKEHIAQITSQLDDLMSKMERVEKAKKPIEEKEKVKESKKHPGLWANINAKHKKGAAPAKKGTAAYKKAVSAAKKINSNK